MKVKKRKACFEGTKLQRELQRTEKDIELVVQDTLNPFFCEFLLIRMNLPRRGDGCAACFLLSPWASELGFSQVHL